MRVLSSAAAPRLLSFSRTLPRLLATMAAAPQKRFVLDPFVLRQFDDPSYTGTRVDFDKQEFEDRINAHDSPLVDGYAPFCKHVFVPNFIPSATLNYLKISADNEGAMRSAYEARTEQELPVLVRWFPAESAPPAPVAKYLDVILYSREQIRKEAAAMGREDDATEPWGIISVKAQESLPRAHASTRRAAAPYPAASATRTACTRARAHHCTRRAWTYPTETIT